MSTREQLEALWRRPGASARARTGKAVEGGPAGHAAPAGTGPAGESCRTCRHLAPVTPGGRRVHKCGLMRQRWTSSVRTDVRVSYPACACWEAGTR